jgi:hypothetical protein
MSTYTDLYKRYKDQPANDVFAHFGWNSDAGEDWDTPFERLATMSKKGENWDFRAARFKRENQKFPILRNYLNHTFLRCQEQDKIAFSDDRSRACFNTGLQTDDEKDIFATFYKNSRTAPDWVLYGFANSYSNKVSPFQPLPEIATYITDASDLVFDLSFRLETNVEHIVETHEERLPDFLKGNRTGAIAALEGATKFLKQRVLRNYKVAIPHWYEGHIQLLLPLYLTSDVEADLAFVADKDNAGKVYRIKTVLTMDQAYIDARLICRPDREWLNP